MLDIYNFYGLSSPPLGQLVRIRTTDYLQEVHQEETVSYRLDEVNLVHRLSVKAAQEWNSIPTTIRDLDTYALFRVQLKNWLISTQICQHYNLISASHPIIVCILFALYLIDPILFSIYYCMIVLYNYEMIYYVFLIKFSLGWLVTSCPGTTDEK